MERQRNPGSAARNEVRSHAGYNGSQA